MANDIEVEDRRRFLISCGRFAAVTPPAMTLLLSTSLTSTAIAHSGRLPGSSSSGRPEPSIFDNGPNQSQEKNKVADNQGSRSDQAGEGSGNNVSFGGGGGGGGGDSGVNATGRGGSGGSGGGSGPGAKSAYGGGEDDRWRKGKP